MTARQSPGKSHFMWEVGDNEAEDQSRYEEEEEEEERIKFEEGKST